MPKKPLSEQVLVVTGASSGLGRAIARARRRARGEGRRHRAKRRGAGQLRRRDRARAARRRSPFPATSPTERQVERGGRGRRSSASGGSTPYVANAIVTVYAEAERLDGGRAAPRLRRQLLRRGLRLLGAFCRTCARRAGPSCTSARRSPTAASRCRPPTARSKAGLRAVLRVGAGRGAEGPARGVDDLARPPGRDQHAAVRPRPPEDRLPAAAGAADLPAGAVRRRRRCTAPSIRSASCRSRGARRSCSGARSSRRARATGCFAAPAGRASTPRSPSRSTRRTSSSIPCLETRARTVASTTGRAARRSGLDSVSCSRRAEGAR